MALTINFNGLTDLQWQAIFEFLNRYLVPNIVKEPGSPRGQIFNAYLEQINLVATGQLGIEDFLFNIGDIFPVAGEDNDRFRELAEQTQYNGFLKKFEEILASEDPASAIQGLFDRYENVGIADNSIILSELDSFGGINSFSLMNPQNVLDRVLIGDNDWGVTVQMCTTTVTTNCVDPKNIKDIWEDFGRHVQVIFKGLEIPGLPEWLPLPGIMRLPTIGEIWDRISGPFNDAAREQMRDCMSKDDDGDGVANTASYCIENRDIAGIITQGILDGTGELVDATTEAVKGIVDKALETLDCVTDPAACATKVKDTIEGIFKSADPTQPGLPDWMRVIIIGSQYGDKVLKELEKIFGSDIDGDGTIGITQEQFDCSTINRNGGVVEKEEDCGACLPNFVEVDGQCTNWTDTGVTAEECAAENREHIPSTGAGTNSACGGCLPDFQVNETGDCVASPIKCEGNQVLNETTGRCEDPPPDCTPGGPCTDETGASGTYDENCDCVADWINSGPSEQDCAALGKTHVPADDSTQTPSSCGSCEQEGWTDTGQSGECEAPNTEAQPCDDPEAVRRGGLSDGECVLPGRSCFSEPSKYSGDDANIDQGQFNSEGFCVAAGGDNGPDDTGGQCPKGNAPQYFPEDTDQDGTFFYNGETLTYDPCDPLGPENSLSFTPAPELICNDENAEPPEGDDGGCGPCKTNFKYSESEKKCVPSGDTNGGLNKGDPCSQDWWEEGDGKVGVIDANGDCQLVGGKCNRGSAEKCESTGFYTSIGYTDSNGDCVCAEICKDPNRKKDLTTGACAADCKDNFEYDTRAGSDTEGLCIPKDTVDLVKCEDPNRNKNDDESCADTCTDGSPAPASGLCPEPVEQCVTPDGTPTGATLESGCEECPTGQDFNTDGICVDTDLSETCDDPDADNYGEDGECVYGPTPVVCNDPNAVNDGEDGPCECKPGFSKDPETLLCVGGTPSCNNGATEESGCDTCPDGTSVLEYEDGMCPSESCPEGQSMDAEGNCVTTGEPPVTPPPETGSGGGGGGGMMGAFTPFLAGISYTPQAVPEPPAPPQKDYMAELDNLIKRSLFEGMA